jgi:hypothetical protein
VAEIATGATRAAQLGGRAAALVVLLGLTWRLLARGLTLHSGGLLSFISLVDLVFHEAGHVIFGLFGSFVGALGGSLNQVLVPAVCTLAFARQRQLAAAAVTLFWTGENVLAVAVYVADARVTRLPLLAEGLTHDWNFLLGRLGLLAWAEALGRLVFVLGALTLLVALALLALDLARCWCGGGGAVVPPG